MAAAGGLSYTVAEFNTIITMVGCLCATVQAATGYHAAYRKKKIQPEPYTNKPKAPPNRKLNIDSGRKTSIDCIA